MNSELTASLIGSSLCLAVGVLATVVGNKALGNYSGHTNYDRWYKAWGKHLKWIGPILVGVAVALFFLTLTSFSDT